MGVGGASSSHLARRCVSKQAEAEGGRGGSEVGAARGAAEGKKASGTQGREVERAFLLLPRAFLLSSPRNRFRGPATLHSGLRKGIA